MERREKDNRCVQSFYTLLSDARHASVSLGPHSPPINDPIGLLISRYRLARVGVLRTRDCIRRRPAPPKRARIRNEGTKPSWRPKKKRAQRDGDQILLPSGSPEAGREEGAVGSRQRRESSAIDAAGRST